MSIPTWLVWVIGILIAIPALAVIGAAILFLIAISGVNNPFR